MFAWTFILVYYGIFLTITVCVVLILSASSRTKETVAVAGSGTQSALLGGNYIGGRNTECLNTACFLSKLRISCSKLIFSELSSFKESLESTPRSLPSLSDSKQAFKTSCSDKSFLGAMFVVAVFSLKLDKIQDAMQSSRYGLCSVG